MEFLLLLGTPLFGALALGVFGARRGAPELNVAVSLVTFIAACALTARVVSEGPLVMAHEQFFIDPSTCSWSRSPPSSASPPRFSRGRTCGWEMDHGRLSPPRLRLYHSMYQLFMTTIVDRTHDQQHGALMGRDGGGNSLHRAVGYAIPHPSEPGGRMEILHPLWRRYRAGALCTILLYFAAEKVLGAEGVTALLWTHLNAVKGQLEPTVLGLAFVFLLVGYGTKVGLAPLHNWLPDAHAEGPTPISAVLSGLLLNVAIYAVVRCKVLVEGSLHSQLPSRMLMSFGLLSVVLASFLLWRQRDIKRLFAYSSIEHMGIITFAFGMGGPVANFAALLHMTVHSLTKSAIFFAVGHAAQKAGSQLMENIRGLITLSPTVGWGLMMGSLAILGMPPFGVFASEFLILTTAMREQPWATPILLTALGVAFAAIFGRVQPMVFGETTAKRLPHPPALLPVFAHLAMVLMLGIYVPPYLADWYRAAARLIEGQ